MKMDSERIIITLATESYSNSRKRFDSTLHLYSDDKIQIWTNEKQVGSPLHQSNPYAFKIYCFREALKMGYRKILWLDSSVYAIKNIQPIWDIIETDGYIMQYAGQFAGTWANDKCLSYFNITRDEAMLMEMYGNAGLLGLDFNFEISNSFFEEWEKSMLAGAFIGNWNNKNKSESEDVRCLGHRHDMVCGSIIANKLKMKYQKGNEILQYGSPSDKILNDTIILKAQGIN